MQLAQGRHGDARIAFDRESLTYDESYEELEGAQRLRRLTTSTILKYFLTGQSVLELNCGTGTDAVALGRKGIQVVATDASPAMIARVKAKINALSLNNVTARVLSFEELENLKGTSFDGALSNMGGLNCLETLNPLAEKLGSLVKPGGHLAICVMSRFCLWEIIAFLGRGNVRSAFRRLKARGTVVDVAGLPVLTFYYSPRSIKKSFSKYFDHVETLGLNVFTPPPSSKHVRVLLPRLISFLELIDTTMARLTPFNGFGDHFLMILRRKTRDLA